MCSSDLHAAIADKLARMAADVFALEAMTLFTATIEGVEEAVINAMIAAKTMTGADWWTVSALPHDQLQAVLRRHPRAPAARWRCASPESVICSRSRTVIVVNIAIVGVVFAIIGSNPVFWILVAALAVYAGIRFAIGLRGWNRAEAQR